MPPPNLGFVHRRQLPIRLLSTLQRYAYTLFPLYNVRTRISSPAPCMESYPRDSSVYDLGFVMFPTERADEAEPVQRSGESSGMLDGRVLEGIWIKCE